MVESDLHTHTLYSDGSASLEEMVRSALSLGVKKLGISDHGYTSFDESYCMKKSAVSSYLREIGALKEKYKGEIEILAGVEWDLFSEGDIKAFDYAIGSVHYLKVGGEYIPVDESPSLLVSACEKYFSGDFYALTDRYYQEVAALADIPTVSIVGHFDLIKKFNEKEKLFPESDPRYVASWKRAADALLQKRKAFEINTGAMHRGYLSTPYPSKNVFEYLKEQGAKFTFGSDSHSPSTIGFLPPETEREYGL